MQRWRQCSGVLLAALLLLVTSGFRPVGLTSDDHTASAVSARDLMALTEPPPIAVSARAAILLDHASGQVLFARAADQPLPPASTTKLMTALLTVESGRYFDQVTIDQADLVGGSSMGLARGETISVRDLLDGLLLPSGNDAAYALARHLGSRMSGSGTAVARFVAAMNARAAALGLTNTVFRNPAGFDVAGHYSTAADLARLTRVALRQPVIAQVVATPSVTVHGRQRAYTLHNSNLLLGDYEGTLGVKTGTTDAAGECLIALVERDGHRLLSVVLGSADRYADTTSLIEWGFAHHRWLTPPPGLVETIERPGWSVSLAPRPPVIVPASQVQFVRYQVRLTPAGRPPDDALLLVLFDRTLAVVPIRAYPYGQTVRPQPGW